MSSGQAPAPSAWRSRLARWAPALLGVAFALGGALGVVAATTHEEAIPQGPDPLVLLSDDVASLQSDMALLGQGLNQNLEQLGEGLDAQAAGRSDVTRRQLGDLSRKVDALSSRLRSLEGRQRAIQAELRSRGGSTPADPAGAATPREPTVEPPAEEPPAEEPSAPETASPDEPVAAAQPRRGLFSFKLASGLDWNQRLRFKVITSLSRVGFDAKSTLHDFTGATTHVEGWLVARLAKADEGGAAEIQAEAAALRTGVEGRDEEMHKVLGVTEHPWIRFVLTGFETDQLDLGAKRLSGVALGTFSIAGGSKEVRVPARISVDKSRRLVLEGELPLRLTDFGIEVPSVAGGAIGMEDEVKVWLSLRLRSLGAEKKAN